MLADIFTVISGKTEITSLVYFMTIKEVLQTTLLVFPVGHIDSSSK
jgi:hypothetical protein